VNRNGLFDPQQPNGLIDQSRKRQVCKGCLEIKARCCVKLGRWRQAREALEAVGLEGAGGAVLGVEDLGGSFISFIYARLN
jgi:hypothetical protein